MYEKWLQYDQNHHGSTYTALKIKLNLYVEDILVKQLYTLYSTVHWPGIIKLFPARESLVNDFPAGDGKIDNLF